MNATIDTLRDQLGAHADAAQKIQAAADEAGRELNEQEQAEVAGHLDSFATIEKEIQRREAIQEVQAKAARTQPKAKEIVQAVKRGPDIFINKKIGTQGFERASDWLQAIVRASTTGQIDPRLLQNASAGNNETTSADGGYAVIPDYRAEIQSLIMGEDTILGKTDVVTIGSNQLVVPTEEDPSWAAAGAYSSWIAEGGSITARKNVLKQVSVTAHKVGVIVPVSSELLEDSAGMQNFVVRKASEKLNWAIDEAILHGDASGKPDGMVHAAACVTQTKVNAQTAATVNRTNVQAMWSKLAPQYRNGAVWFAHPDVENQLMSIDVTNGVPLYMPPGGLADAPYARLLGKPVIYTQHAKALGTEGDLILCNPKGYLSVVKGSNIRQDVSLSVYFSTDDVAFRFLARMGGTPWLAAAITDLNGGGTRSSIVSLETRS